MATDLGSMFNAALKQKTYAEMLAEQAASTAPTPSWGAALARALQGGLAGVYERQDEASTAGAINKWPGMGGPSATGSAPPSVSTPMGTPNITPTASASPQAGGLQYPDRFYGQNEMTPIDAGAANPKELAAALQMNPVDFDKTARTVIGEAGNEQPVGKQAVANVILNRGALAGQTPSQVIKPSQFEPYQTPEGRARMSVGYDTPAYQQAAQAVYAAGQADPTGGATKFYGPGAQAALGRAPPKWDDGTGQDIGGQRFFRQPFAGQAPGSASATMALAPVEGPSNPIPEPKPVPTQVAQAGGTPIVPQQPQQRQPSRPVPEIPPEVRPQLQALWANPATRGQAVALYQQYMTPKETYSQRIGPDGTPIQENSLTHKIEAIPQGPEATRIVQEMYANPQKYGFKGPDDPALKEAAAHRLAGTPNVNLNTAQKGLEVMATESAKDFKTAQEASREAVRRKGVYDSLEQAASGFQPGATAEVRLKAKSLMKDLGLIGDQGVSDAEAFKMLQTQLQIHAAPQGQGSVSNYERSLYSGAVPNMTQSPEGLAKAIAVGRKLDDFDRQVAQIWRNNAKANGGVPNSIEVNEEIEKLGAPLSPSEMNALRKNGEGARKEDTTQPSTQPAGGTTKGGIKWNVQ